MSLKPNVFNKLCPSRDIIFRLSGKWTILILNLLESKPKRFSEIKQQVQGISQKVLTENLRSLERDGLISRNVLSTRPLMVEYRTTKLSNELLKILSKLTSYAQNSMKTILNNNKNFDKKINTTRKISL